MGLRDVTSSEKIFKVKSLLQDDLDIDNVKVENANDDETTSRLLSHIGHHAMFSRTSFSITWQQGSSTSYCTLHTEKVKKRLGNCCKEHWTFVWKFSFWKLRFLWSSNLVERRTDHSIHWFSKLCVHSFRNLGLFSWCYYSTYNLAQRQSVIYVIFHQITLININAAYISQLDDVFVAAQ